MWRLVIGVLFFYFSSIASEEEYPPCPPSHKIYPCYCDSEPGYASIFCEKLNNLDKLKPILEITKGWNLSYGIDRSKLGDIPSDLFKGQLCTDVNFYECKIGSFGDRPFTGLEMTLKKLDIYGSVDKRIKDLETFPLGHLKKLEFLAFEGNDIKRLGNEWFEGGPISLKQLMLQANDIEELGDRAFASLLNLEQVWMGDNRFKIILRSMFPQPAKKLSILEISFNGIEILPEDMFTGMPALKSVNVAGNKLKTVPENTWSRIWGQLEEVYLERNVGFECDQRLKWIYKRKLPKIMRGSCGYGGKFGRKNLNELTLDDFE